MPPTHRVPHPAPGSVRCRVVVGATGFGKSHLAHQQEPDARVLRAIDLVDARGTVDLGPLDAPTAIVESLHRLSPDGQASLVRALADHPGTARVTLTGRTPLAAGLHDMDLAVETCGPDELRLSAADLRHLVRTALDPADEGTTHRIADVLGRLTDGWPALVRLALDEGPGPWERGADPTEWLSRPQGRVTRWVETQLLPSLPAEARRLLTLGRDLRPFPRALAARAVDGEPSDATAWDLLCDTGVITAASDEPRVVRLVAACLARAARAPEGASSWWAAAGDWYLAHGHPEAALRSARYADDAARCQAILDEHGDDVIAAGGAQEVLTTVAALPRAHASLRTRILHGHAARLAGDPQLAQDVLEGVLADTEAWGEPPPADLLWRLAAVHYGRADFRAAQELCSGARIPLPTTEPPVTRGMRLATLALCQWMVGDDAAAERAAAEALACAGGAGDEARATAHLAQSLLLTGARRHNALAAALTTAERCGNVYLVQRTLANLADAHLVAAEYAAARDAAQRAIDLVDRTGAVGCYVAALHNSGEALLALGDLEGARVQFLRCLDIARGHGLDRTPGALWGLAEIDYQSGHLEDARAAFEEAVDLARETGERQVLVPTLARLATILATEPRDDADLVRAEDLAGEAVDQAPEECRGEALTALGWVLLGSGDVAGAGRIAEAATESARAAQNRRALGPALELAAATTPDPAEAGALLQQAAAGYHRSEAVVSAARVQLALTRVPGDHGGSGTAARAASRRLRRLGVLARALHPPGPAMAGSIEIRVLGGFTVTRDGVPVPVSAWRSRQARTLLKLLVARQGRPIGREELCEILWPGDDPAKTGHRLSVLLSTLRGALDPAKRHATEHFVGADNQGVRLVLGNATLDLLDFLDDAAEAGRLADDGEEEPARQLLADLLAGYRGEAFEEDPYETWAADVRDHVRATWVQSLRLAARLAGRAGDIDAAVTCLVRLLAADAYDEPAHRMLLAVLVRAGRHGEARRAFDRWTRSMGDVGAEPPDPGLLEPAPPARVVTAR